MLIDQAASPPAWTPGHRVKACRSGESSIAAEVLMNNAGYVKTVVEMGWGGVKNGALLALAANEFDAFPPSTRTFLTSRTWQTSR